MLAKLKSDPITTVLGILGSLAAAAAQAPGWAAATNWGKLLILAEVAGPAVFGFFASDSKGPQVK